MDKDILLGEEREHSAFTALYRASRLEIDEGWEKTCHPVFSVAARRGKALLGAATVSRRFGRLVLDYVAVQPEFRVQGLGRRLVNACADYARGQGETQLWIAARTPGFFLALGAKPSGGAALMADCRSCPDYGTVCSPVELTIQV